MEGSADRAARDTAVSVRQAGLVYTVTFPVFPARWPPNSKVLMWSGCVVTLASVWTLETHTIVTVRPDTRAATVRSRWTNAFPIRARTEQLAPTTWADTPVNVCQVIME